MALIGVNLAKTRFRRFAFSDFISQTVINSFVFQSNEIVFSETFSGRVRIRFGFGFRIRFGFGSIGFGCDSDLVDSDSVLVGFDSDLVGTVSIRFDSDSIRIRFGISSVGIRFGIRFGIQFAWDSVWDSVRLGFGLD